MTNWTLVKASLWYNDVTKMTFTAKLLNFGEGFSDFLPDGNLRDINDTRDQLDG